MKERLLYFCIAHFFVDTIAFFLIIFIPLFIVLSMFSFFCKVLQLMK